MERITVTIPAQEYSSNIFTNPRGCYLAQVLKEVLPESIIKVLSSEVFIDNEVYKSKDAFDSRAIKKAFEKGRDLKITLVNVKNQY